MSQQANGTPKELPRVTWQRILREVRARTAPRKPRGIKVGSSVKEIAQQLQTRQTPRFFGLIPEQAALLGQFFPEARDTAIAQADRMRLHKFDILGSGEKDLGKEIDWHSDPISGYTWPVEHFTRLELIPEDKQADIRIPWELNRFYHALRLGQAYLYTFDEFYAKEITDQIVRWIKKNPYEFGINWARPMDVAIRVVNWVWAYYSIIESKSLTPKFLTLWLASLREHGNYLLKYVDENEGPYPNHTLAALAGLAYLGILFPEFSEASRWRALGLGRFWLELEKSVNPDGMYNRASVDYHRFATELALSVAGLCIVNSIDIPTTARVRMASMLDVIMSYTQPDGLAPTIGDTWNERLHILSVHSNPVRMAQDHRHLLGLGSLVLERQLNEWAGFVDPAQHGWSIAAGYEWQDAFWCFASDAAARMTDVITQTVKRPELVQPDDWVEVRPGVRVRARALTQKPLALNDVTSSHGMEASGLFVMRERDMHLVVDAGDAGQLTPGEYGHDDPLSVTLWAFDNPLLIDPGSYRYVSGTADANGYRSISYHNTLQVEPQPGQNGKMQKSERLKEDMRIVLHRWISKDSFDLLDASHAGYKGFTEKVVHRRQVWFDKKSRLWLLHDSVRLVSLDADTGELATEDEDAEASKMQQSLQEASEITLTLWFHFAPMVVKIDRERRTFVTDGEQGANLIIMPVAGPTLRPELETGWHAPAYGIRKKAPVAKFTGRVKLPVELVTLLYPYQSNKVGLDVARAAGRAALANMQRVLTPAAITTRLQK